KVLGAFAPRLALCFACATAKQGQGVIRLHLIGDRLLQVRERLVEFVLVKVAFTGEEPGRAGERSLRLLAHQFLERGHGCRILGAAVKRFPWLEAELLAQLAGRGFLGAAAVSFGRFSERFVLLRLVVDRRRSQLVMPPLVEPCFGRQRAVGKPFGQLTERFGRFAGLIECLPRVPQFVERLVESGKLRMLAHERRQSFGGRLVLLQRDLAAGERQARLWQAIVGGSGRQERLVVAGGGLVLLLPLARRRAQQIGA